ncbi:unnamed protein product, partial [Meganyctiphanes norvegica]
VCMIWSVMMRSLFLSLLLVGASWATTTYQGQQVWRLHVPMESTNSVQSLLSRMELDVWGDGREWVDVRVEPHQQRQLADALGVRGVQHTVNIPDLDKLIAEERSSLGNRQQGLRIDTGAYNQWEDIESYLGELDAENPLVTVTSIGQTYEGRQLLVAKVATESFAPKPSVWFDCGIHAREWITPATCLWGLDRMTSGVDDGLNSLLDKYDVYMMPVHNPDGYHYTWHDDRMWRKNRQVYDDNMCDGVDLNRNFDDGHWGGIGTSDNSCSDTYHGPSAFSELEAQAVRDYATSLYENANLTAFFTIHSYSQLWMYAYGYSADVVPEHDDLDRVSKVGVDALTAVHGTDYEYGSIYSAIYPASGTSVDWGYSIGVAHTYTLELRDKGSSGFLLPATEIIPCAEETWAGLVAAMLAI